MLFTEWWFW